MIEFVGTTRPNITTDGEFPQSGHTILDFCYQKIDDHSSITMADLAIDCGLDDDTPIAVQRTLGENQIRETWQLLETTDPELLADAEAVYVDFLGQVKILADRGLADIYFEAPEGQAGQAYFLPPSPSVQ